MATPQDDIENAEAAGELLEDWNPTPEQMNILVPVHQIEMEGERNITLFPAVEHVARSTFVAKTMLEYNATVPIFRLTADASTQNEYTQEAPEHTGNNRNIEPMIDNFDFGLREGEFYEAAPANVEPAEVQDNEPQMNQAITELATALVGPFGPEHVVFKLDGVDIEGGTTHQASSQYHGTIMHVNTRLNAERQLLLRVEIQSHQPHRVAEPQASAMFGPAYTAFFTFEDMPEDLALDIVDQIKERNPDFANHIDLTVELVAALHANLRQTDMMDELAHHALPLMLHEASSTRIIQVPLTKSRIIEMIEEVNTEHTMSLVVGNTEADRQVIHADLLTSLGLIEQQEDNEGVDIDFLDELEFFWWDWTENQENMTPEEEIPRSAFDEDRESETVPEGAETDLGALFEEIENQAHFPFRFDM